MRLFGGDTNRREQIVSRTLELLATTPLERLTTRDIAAAVGVSQPALFRHFRSREAILVAAVEATRLTLESTVAEIIGCDDPPLSRCGALARALAEHVRRAPGLPRLLFADALLDAPELDAVVRGLVATQHALVAELLRLAASRGELAEDVVPEAGATLFVGMMQAVAFGRSPVVGERTPGERLEPVLALWTRAVRLREIPVGEPGPAVLLAAPPPATTARAARLDVRPVLASGRDPLTDILSVLDTLAPTSILVVTAPFRPLPLERLLAGRGHRVTARPGNAGAWDLLCVVGGAPELVDLTEMEAPEPLERVLALASGLSAGASALAHVPRWPAWLLPQLNARGIGHEVVELTDGTAVVRLTGRG